MASPRSIWPPVGLKNGYSKKWVYHHVPTLILFGGLEHFSIQLGMSSSQLTNSYFSEGLKLFSIVYRITLPADELIFFKMVIAPPTRILRHAHTWEYPISSCTWLYPLDLQKILVCFALKNAPIRESIGGFDSYPDIPLMANIGIWPKYFKMFTRWCPQDS